MNDPFHYARFTHMGPEATTATPYRLPALDRRRHRVDRLLENLLGRRGEDAALAALAVGCIVGIGLVARRENRGR